MVVSSLGAAIEAAPIGGLVGNRQLPIDLTKYDFQIAASILSYLLERSGQPAFSRAFRD